MLKARKKLVTSRRALAAEKADIWKCIGIRRYCHATQLLFCRRAKYIQTRFHVGLKQPFESSFSKKLVTEINCFSKTCRSRIGEGGRGGGWKGGESVFWVPTLKNPCFSGHSSSILSADDVRVTWWCVSRQHVTRFCAPAPQPLVPDRRFHVHRVTLVLRHWLLSSVRIYSAKNVAVC